MKKFAYVAWLMNANAWKVLEGMFSTIQTAAELNNKYTVISFKNTFLNSNY